MIDPELDENRVKEFVRKTIEEYTTCALRVDDYVKEVVSVDENESDGSFFQIGIRSFVEKDIFLPQRGPVYIAPQIIGVGRAIAIGEVNHFIRSIIENKEINTEKRDLTEIHLPALLMELALKASGNIALVPVTLKTRWLKNSAWKKFEDKNVLIFPISDKLLSNKIIILDRFTAQWSYVRFFNAFTNSKERLDIRLGGVRESKIELIVRTLNKLLYNPKNVTLIKGE